MIEEVLTDYSEDGVDLTLIRWFLSLTPAERLEYAQSHANSAGASETEWHRVIFWRRCARFTMEA